MQYLGRALKGEVNLYIAQDIQQTLNQKDTSQYFEIVLEQGISIRLKKSSSLKADLLDTRLNFLITKNLSVFCCVFSQESQNIHFYHHKTLQLLIIQEDKSIISFSLKGGGSSCSNPKADADKAISTKQQDLGKLKEQLLKEAADKQIKERDEKIQQLMKENELLKLKQSPGYFRQQVEDLEQEVKLLVTQAQNLVSNTSNKQEQIQELERQHFKYEEKIKKIIDEANTERLRAEDYLKERQEGVQRLDQIAQQVLDLKKTLDKIFQGSQLKSLKNAFDQENMKKNQKLEPLNNQQQKKYQKNKQSSGKTQLLTQTNLILQKQQQELNVDKLRQDQPQQLQQMSERLNFGKTSQLLKSQSGASQLTTQALQSDFLEDGGEDEESDEDEFEGQEDEEEQIDENKTLVNDQELQEMRKLSQVEEKKQLRKFQKFLKFAGFIELIVLGQGAFGKVIQVIKQSTKERFAFKVFGNSQDYQVERNSMLNLQSSLTPDISERSIERLIESLDDFNLLIYESGLCSLRQFVSQMNEKYIYFFERGHNRNREGQLRYLLCELFQISSELHKASIYWSDMKLDNIVLTTHINEKLGKEGCQILQVKAIDFGGCSRKFDEFVAFTPGYAPHPSSVKCSSQVDREIWELRMLGNTMLEIMTMSIYAYIKQTLILLVEQDDQNNLYLKELDASALPVTRDGYSEESCRQRLELCKIFYSLDIIHAVDNLLFSNDLKSIQNSIQEVKSLCSGIEGIEDDYNLITAITEKQLQKNQNKQLQKQKSSEKNQKRLIEQSMALDLFERALFIITNNVQAKDLYTSRKESLIDQAYILIITHQKQLLFQLIENYLNQNAELKNLLVAKKETKSLSPTIQSKEDILMAIVTSNHTLLFAPTVRSQNLDGLIALAEEKFSNDQIFLFNVYLHTLQVYFYALPHYQYYFNYWSHSLEKAMQMIRNFDKNSPIVNDNLLKKIAWVKYISAFRFEKKDCKEAIHSLQEEVFEIEVKRCDNTFVYAEICSDLGRLYELEKSYQTAVDYSMKSLAVQRSTTGIQNTLYEQQLGRVGKALHRLKKYDEAWVWICGQALREFARKKCLCLDSKKLVLQGFKSLNDQNNVLLQLLRDAIDAYYLFQMNANSRKGAALLQLIDFLVSEEEASIIQKNKQLIEQFQAFFRQNSNKVEQKQNESIQNKKDNILIIKNDTIQKVQKLRQLQNDITQALGVAKEGAKGLGEDITSLVAQFSQKDLGMVGKTFLTEKKLNLQIIIN